MATFVGKMGMASGDIPESYIFVKGYHHSRTFSRELEKVANSRTFSFADYSRYTVHSVIRLYASTFCYFFAITIHYVNVVLTPTVHSFI